LTQGECTACSSDEYVGAYNGDKCRTGCGSPSQQYYKLPIDWLNSADSGEMNSIVLFEELGGVPSEIQLVEISMVDAV